jgi:hypothetical protein
MGIYGSLLFETLPAWILIIMEYVLEGVFFHVVPQRKSNIRGKMTDCPIKHNFTESIVKTDQAEFERRMKIAMEITTRQSDHNITKLPFNNGVTSLTRLAGQEYQDLVMLTMVTLDKMLPSRNNHSEKSQILNGPRDSDTGLWRINLKQNNNHIP